MIRSLILCCLFLTAVPVCAQVSGWEQTEGPMLNSAENEYITSLLLSEKGTLFVCTDNWRSFYSGDHGKSWIENTADSFLGQYAIVFKQAPDGTIYSGTLSGAFLSSTDEGKTWRQLSILSSVNEISDIAFHPNGNIYALTPQYCERSSDGGKTWTRLTGITSQYPFVAIGIAPDGTIYITRGNDGLYRSTDGGETWKLIRPSYREAFLIMPDGTLVLYPGSLLFSTDRGESWKKSKAELFKIHSLVFHNGLFYAASLAGIFSSKDNGDTWTDISAGVLVKDIP